MPDDGHVLRSIAGAQPALMLVEGDVEHPVQPVFDAPMRAHDGREGFGCQLNRTEVVVAPRRLKPAAPRRFAGHHADHG
jgi:hypothetical protein